MGFKKSVLTVALVIFIINVLLILAVVIKNSYKNAVFPPEISLCPDYWKVSSGSGKKCIATNQNRGIFREGEVSPDFNDMSMGARIINVIGL